MAFDALVRFELGGKKKYGNLIATTERGFEISELEGSLTEGFAASGKDVIIITKKLLCPLDHTPIIQCVGVNYQNHVTETKLAVPKYPVIFSKPSDALAGPTDDISIHPDAQEKLDYEGELVVVIGRDAKNVSEANALDYVLGYTVGNDVSARNFQVQGASGGQYGYSKSFDSFAPIGPAIWSPKVVQDPQKLRYILKVNGEVRQETGTDDMIWSVRQIISHLSRGTTLRKGTVIMTGTPAGVGFFHNKFLQNGDIVEIELKGLGTMSNKMVFE